MTEGLFDDFLPAPEVIEGRLRPALDVGVPGGFGAGIGLTNFKMGSQGCSSLRRKTRKS